MTHPSIEARIHCTLVLVHLTVVAKETVLTYTIVPILLGSACSTVLTRSTGTEVDEFGTSVTLEPVWALTFVFVMVET